MFTWPPNDPHLILIKHLLDVLENRVWSTPCNLQDFPDLWLTTFAWFYGTRSELTSPCLHFSFCCIRLYWKIFWKLLDPGWRGFLESISELSSVIRTGQPSSSSTSCDWYLFRPSSIRRPKTDGWTLIHLTNKGIARLNYVLLFVTLHLKGLKKYSHKILLKFFF